MLCITNIWSLMVKKISDVTNFQSNVQSLAVTLAFFFKSVHYTQG